MTKKKRENILTFKSPEFFPAAFLFFFLFSFSGENLKNKTKGEKGVWIYQAIFMKQKVML